MKRYFKLIKKLGEQGASAEEVVRALKFDQNDWAKVWAAARIYLEDGGKRLKREDFLALVPSPLRREDFEYFMKS